MPRFLTVLRLSWALTVLVTLLTLLTTTWPSAIRLFAAPRWTVLFTPPETALLSLVALALAMSKGLALASARLIMRPVEVAADATDR